LLILYGLTCFPLMVWAPHNADGWHMLLASPRVYPLMGLALYLYGTTFGLPLTREWLRAHRRETWAFGVFFLFLGAVGVVQAVRHERGLFESYSHRILTLPGSLLQGEPAVGAEGLFVTRMPGNSPAFETWRWSSGQFTPLPPAEDEFHPASAPGLKEVWIEQAGPVSNIVRLSNFDRPGGPTVQIEVVNGEQPSVSPDDKRIVFVRENRGRGVLWLKDLAPGDNMPSGPQRQLTGDTHDVWEAAFEPGGRRIVFTSAAHGQPELYSLDMASRQITSLSIAGPARYPAYSPDGKWLAYSHCERGTWHLYVTRSGSANSRRLTDGEYNAMSPVWEGDSKSLIYATDARRGLNMTALSRMTLPSDF
jgi:dipeptidyl aminopeptidase/acylaminoacyl peptidase